MRRPAHVLCQQYSSSAAFAKANIVLLLLSVILQQHVIATDTQHTKTELAPSISSRTATGAPDHVYAPAAFQTGVQDEQQAAPTLTCPAGYKKLHRAPSRGPADRSVSYSSLPALGWDLPPRRGRVDNTETAIKSFDFWSVLCSGHAKHTSDWKSCKQADRPSGVGATHIRYDCTDKTFWLLMYVWDGIYMSRNAGDLWAVNSCGPACTSSDAAFLRFQKDGTGGSCGTTCSNAANSSCCRDVWPVTDGTAGWVGWLAKGTFSLINSSAVFHDRVMVSMCWGDTCGNTTLTASTPNGYSSSASPGVCFSCADNTPPTAPPPSQPADAGVTVTPGVTIPLGRSHNHTFTVTANGPMASQQVSLLVSLPTFADVGYKSVTVVHPTGKGDYPIGCDGPISQDNGTAILACYLGTMLPGTQASITLKFTPVATANYTPILGQLMFPAELESMENDIVASNNSATTWLAVLDCPPYKGIIGGRCMPALCEPCPDPEPTVYLSTGLNSNPPNGLWQVTNWQPGNMSLRAEFLCVVDHISVMIGDIAVLHGGDIVLLTVRGDLRFIAADDIPTPSTDFSRRCFTRQLYTFGDAGGGGYTGLSSGFRSDMLLATTGQGQAIPLIMQTGQEGFEVGPLPPNSTEQPIIFPCWFSSDGSALANTGGTDITPGPDGAYYRWCSKDFGMNYTGTKYSTEMRNGYPQLTGAAAFVSEAIDTQHTSVAPFANAGAFCTSQYVVGTGAYSRLAPGNDPLQGSYAAFWAVGAAKVTSMSQTKPPNGYPRARLVSQTAPVTKADGNVRIDGLRVNGAAVRPRCEFPAL